MVSHKILVHKLNAVPALKMWLTKTKCLYIIACIESKNKIIILYKKQKQKLKITEVLLIIESSQDSGWNNTDSTLFSLFDEFQI